MRKENIIEYLKMLGALLMISPLVYSFFVLDYGYTLTPFLITLLMYIGMMALGIPTLNYLNHGMFRYRIRENNKNK